MPMIRRESGLQTCLIEPQLTVPQSSDPAAGENIVKNWISGYEFLREK